MDMMHNPYRLGGYVLYAHRLYPLFTNYTGLGTLIVPLMGPSVEFLYFVWIDFTNRQRQAIDQSGTVFRTEIDSLSSTQAGSCGIGVGMGVTGKNKIMQITEDMQLRRLYRSRDRLCGGFKDSPEQRSPEAR